MKFCQDSIETGAEENSDTLSSVREEVVALSVDNNSCTMHGGRYEGKFVSPNVINLSKRNLSDAEISLLSKGLKFVPTPNGVNKARIKEELEIFGRKLRLMWHFRNDEREITINPFQKKSKFNPKRNDASIEIYLSKLEEEILNIDTRLNYSNLTKEEKKALYALRDDTSIIIKEADKGSGIVVWDREDYLEEAKQQLDEKDVYKKVNGDVEGPLIKLIKGVLGNVRKRGDISDKTLDYFLVNNPKLGRFYLLPKIHKRLHNVPGRFVISNSSYYTENISSFVEFHLKPLAQKVKSYIKDTNDFLKKLSNLPSLSDDVILCTIDVVGLYPNIPHEGGLAAIKEALDKREDKTISTESILELAECVLKNNVFEHNEMFYKQLRGTAIGTKMAPPYAIVFMGKLEEDFLKEQRFKPMIWWRYIDDIFMLWEHGEKELKIFLEALNCCHPTIKFTAEYSKEKVNFLDVSVRKISNHLVTDLFIKPTDTHQYLHASSCHVYHSKKSIPYSQALRLNRICSENILYDKRCNELETWLKCRGYSDKMVRSQILKARKFSRKHLLETEKLENSDKKLVLNVTYHPSFSRLKHILNNIHLLLTPDKEHEKVFPTIPIVGFKKGKSLKDFLVRAKVPPIEKPKGGCAPCGGKRCQVCNFMKNTDEFHTITKNKTYFIRSNNILNCNSKYVVYMIECKTCGKPYVGSTETLFRTRFNNYRSSQRNFEKGKKVLQESFHSHFTEDCHCGEDDWNVTLIDQANNLEEVRRKESFWQHELNTFEPHGLNEREVTLEYKF